MTLHESLLELANQVRRNKGQPPLPAISRDAHMRRDLGFDSLDLAELTVRIEERFRVDAFDEGVLQHWGELVGRLERHAAARG